MCAIELLWLTSQGRQTLRCYIPLQTQPICSLSIELSHKQWQKRNYFFLNEVALSNHLQGRLQKFHVSVESLKNFALLSSLTEKLGKNIFSLFDLI